MWIVLHTGLSSAKADLGPLNPLEPFQGPFDHEGSGKSGHPLDPEDDLLNRRGPPPHITSGSISAFVSSLNCEKQWEEDQRRESFTPPHLSLFHQRPERVGKHNEHHVDGQH